MYKKFILLLFAIIVILAIFAATGLYSEEKLTTARAEGYEAGYRIGYDAGHEDGYNVGYEEGYDAPKPASRPQSGEILSGREYNESEITITADKSLDYVVSLKDMLDIEYVSFYVRAGDTVTVGVPANYLYVYFACGKQWYGYGKGLMFGEDTSYSKDDEVMDFTEYTWEYALQPVYDGNFSETPSNEDEFFDTAM